MKRKTKKKIKKTRCYPVTDKISWLLTRGGRTLEDVEEDEIGEFVWMGSGRNNIRKVYIPKEFK